MKDLQLKDLTGYISTASPTLIQEKETGCSFIATIRDFSEYAECYVREIYASDNRLRLTITREI